MKRISEALQTIVSTSPFLEEGLMRGIVNLSALARELRPQLERELMKSISDSAVLMALKRLSESLDRKTAMQVMSFRKMVNLTVRSELTEYTFARSADTLKRLRQVLDDLEPESGDYVSFSHGGAEITIIISASAASLVERFFSGEREISRLPGLSAVSIRLPAESVYIPGVHYGILKQLAWSGVNVIEVVSTYTELTIVLERTVVDQGFSILMAYFRQEENG